MLSQLTNTFFPICSLAISIFLCCVFFLKKNMQNKETKIYAKLLICGLFEAFLYTFICLTGDFFFNENTYQFYVFLNKILCIIYLIWMTLLFYYIIDITNKIKNPKKVKIVLTILDIIFGILILINNIDLTLDLVTKFSNATGNSINLLYGLCSFYLLAIMIVLLLNFNNRQMQKKFIPCYVLITLFTISLIIRLIDPYFNITSNIFSLVLLIMYHTIENPDTKMIDQLNLAKDAAEKANMAKTEFLSNMSHEIRTPLNAIVGFSECMLPSTDLNEIKGFAKDIVDASHNLLEIVNGILDISKIEANKMEVIPKEYNPREVFNSLCKLVRPRIKEKPIEFKVTISPDLPGILKGDMGKVKQVVLNILTNAAKYTDKGEIEFNITCVNRQDTKKCLLYIAVKDTGRGIKKENIEKLFNKFERIDEDKNTTIEGTGLGLAITKSLTEMMGGKITVSSKFGEGSTFRIYLEQEIISMDIPESSTEEIEIDYSTHNGKRILIVDDSKINLKVANQILKPYNFNVKLVESGYEALELMESQTFDLILMDIMMPKMNGVETLRRLKKMEGFDIPVIALTADAIEGTDEKYLNAGFDGYLSKPIDRYELDRALKKFLGGNKNE